MEKSEGPKFNLMLYSEKFRIQQKYVCSKINSIPNSLRVIEIISKNVAYDRINSKWIIKLDRRRKLIIRIFIYNLTKGISRFHTYVLSPIHGIEKRKQTEEITPYVVAFFDLKEVST